MKKYLVPGFVVVVCSALGAGVIWKYAGSGSTYDKVRYPYVCKDCKAVVDVQEYRKPGNWVTPKETKNDSIVYCLRCKKGWAYPVGLCDTCNTEYIMYDVPGGVGCPKCYPAVAEKALKAGLGDLVYKRP